MAATTETAAVLGRSVPPASTRLDRVLITRRERSLPQQARHVLQRAGGAGPLGRQLGVRAMRGGWAPGHNFVCKIVCNGIVVQCPGHAPVS